MRIRHSPDIIAVKFLGDNSLRYIIQILHCLARENYDKIHTHEPANSTVMKFCDVLTNVVEVRDQNNLTCTRLLTIHVIDSLMMSLMTSSRSNL